MQSHVALFHGLVQLIHAIAQLIFTGSLNKPVSLKLPPQYALQRSACGTSQLSTKLSVQSASSVLTALATVANP